MRAGVAESSQPVRVHSEFEKYQVTVSSAGGGGGAGGAGGGGRRLAPLLRARDAPPTAVFEGLEPGAHYTVTVKTMSGKVTSWPASADFTLSECHRSPVTINALSDVLGVARREPIF